MKTLYERLEPEVIEGLEWNSKRFHGATDKIVSELSSHKFWSDLKVGTIQAVLEEFFAIQDDEESDNS